MSNRFRIATIAFLLSLLAGTAGAEPIEINPFNESGLSMKWDLAPAEGAEGWNVAYDVLACKTKGGQVGEAIYKAGKWETFQLHFKMFTKFRGARVLLVPLEGERVEIEIKRTWLERKEDWTPMVIDIKGGKAILTSAGKKRGEWDVPAGKKKFGFFLKKGGFAQFKRIRVLWDPPLEPVDKIETGFIDLLAPDNFEKYFETGKASDGNSIEGEWNVKDGVLSGRNPESRMSRKLTIKLSRFGVADYEVRFKLKAGTKEFRFFAYVGAGGNNKVWLLDSYLTGEGAWQRFVIKRQGGRYRMNVNGNDVIQGEQGPTGRTKIGLHLNAQAQVQIRDFHIKAAGLNAPPSSGKPAAGGNNAGGGAPKPGGSTELFDGETLSNWAQHPKEGVWKAVNGAIYALNQTGANASLLYRMGRVTDYTLSFELEAGAKGLLVMAKYNPDTRKGTQIDIPASSLDKDFNKVEIVVKGAQARLLVNGKQISSGTALEGSWLFGFVLRHGGTCRISDLKIGPPK
jgi:3-keto-disaccharide hydrolase